LNAEYFNQPSVNRTVKMKNLLLTVLAFGLLSSSAFAEDKTPERLREESNHIFGVEGLENQTFTRFVASGAKQRIGFYVDLNPDCSAAGDINVRVTKQPEHGTVETVATTDYTYFPKENIRSKCNRQKVKGTLVNYKAAEKYTGSDEFDLLILFPDGLAWEYHFDIRVR
jgi:hypothetical protein